MLTMTNLIRFPSETMLASTSAEIREAVEMLRPFANKIPLETIVPSASPEVISLLSLLLQMGE